ncbi:DUF3445 domain-containing protein [Rhodovulum sp. BSW8]|uniref:DUF3445 domain-containing protein n=1 Tax=Rhodovulum sp. BSW8 TaxID=2259645 RepID=UPI0014027DC2|nr:DUF3445 domain-containing protein [Rhodovulum sp. BSW8]
MAPRWPSAATHRDAVHAMRPEAGDAAWELYDLVLADLARRPGTVIGATEVLRPDGVRAPLEAPPLVRLGRLLDPHLCRGD